MERQKRLAERAASSGRRFANVRRRLCKRTPKFVTLSLGRERHMPMLNAGKCVDERRPCGRLAQVK